MEELHFQTTLEYENDENHERSKEVLRVGESCLAFREFIGAPKV